MHQAELFAFHIQIDGDINVRDMLPGYPGWLDRLDPQDVLLQPRDQAPHGCRKHWDQSTVGGEERADHRQLPGTKLQHDIVDLAGLEPLPIDQFFVHDVAEEKHRYPPPPLSRKSGTVRIVMIDRTMRKNILAMFVSRPLRVSPIY